VSDVAHIAVSLAPVFAFLAALVALDSFKLVRPHSIVVAILAGCGAAGLCLAVTRWVFAGADAAGSYSRYGAPVIEETLKAGFVVFLIARRRVGFIVDAAVLGFAVGAGFAFIENVYYLRSVDDSNLMLWVVRGLGTAVMHGGTTASFAVLSQGLSERRARHRGAPPIVVFLPGLAGAIGLHLFFNLFVLSPAAHTVAQILVLPGVFALVFSRSEKSLRDWLEVGLDTDVRILDDIRTGAISQTRPGQYLESLRSRFHGEVVADMLCLLRVHLELAARAKGILLMREAGFAVPDDPGIRERLEELAFLEKSVGPTGRLAIAPILPSSSRDLWQLYVVGRK
jgi:RsiW-degrading membrane proteinase PrsW (M82 family)